MKEGGPGDGKLMFFFYLALVKPLILSHMLFYLANVIIGRKALYCSSRQSKKVKEQRERNADSRYGTRFISNFIPTIKRLVVLIKK